MRTFHVENFGCRATQADGAAIERDLLARGFVAAERGAAEANVVVLNTCTVTSAADHDARAAIRRIHRANPAAQIIVTGCYAQRAPDDIAAISGVSAVAGNSHKHTIGALAVQVVRDSPPSSRTGFASDEAATSAFVPLDRLAPDQHRLAPTFVSDIFAHTQLLAAPVFEGVSGWERTRPNLKVQDGCNNRCSFCVIPFVRGRSRSLSLGDVLREARALVGAGYRELVLSGINLGRWGRDTGAGRFVDLVRAVLAGCAIEKIRISSVEPMDWSNELIELVANEPRIAKHAHVPLQSGCEATLRRMRRKYRVWHYADRLQRLRAAMPDAAIGADVMTGFPGESEQEFEESRAFIEEMPFTYLHVFTYSARPGTSAAAMPAHVPVEVARERNAVLRELAAKKNSAFRERFIGRELQVLTLESKRRDGGTTEALSDNFIRVRLDAVFAPNQWVNARVASLTNDGLLASATGSPRQ